MTLIKPDLEDELIVRCLWDAYGLDVKKVVFLPLGADLNTAVYRIITKGEANYFLKLRRGEFNEAAVSVPKYLAERGIKQIIPPLATLRGELWKNLNSFKLILYPYVDGVNGMDAILSKQQWIEFGATLKKFHSADIPQALTRSVPRETFSNKWREMVKKFLWRIENELFPEVVAAEMAVFLKSKRRNILQCVERAESLAVVLGQQSFEYILCHGDIHGWNLFIDRHGALYIVDWDTLIFAPKERDLMFIGAGLGDTGRTSFEEEALFYQGYGETNINHAAICYYRYERIIEDIGVFCEQIFLSDEGGEDRRQSLEYLKSNFLPAGTIERARHSDTFQEDV